MDAELIREIATKIAHEELLANLRLYGLILAITIVINACVAFGGRYLEKRAETKAIKSDLGEIIRQQKLMAEATESLRSSISITEWRERESIRVRRDKLELMATLLDECESWLDKSRDEIIAGEFPYISGAPISKLKIVVGLYLPELKSELLELSEIFFQMNSMLVSLGSKLHDAKATSNMEGVKEAHASFVESYRDIYPKFLKAKSKVLDKCEKVMPSLLFFT